MRWAIPLPIRPKPTNPTFIVTFLLRYRLAWDGSIPLKAVFLCLAYDAFLAFTLMHMKSLPSRKSLAFALLFCVAAIPTIITSQDAHAHHWAYEGKEGPAEWGKIDNTFAACSTGH